MIKEYFDIPSQGRGSRRVVVKARAAVGAALSLALLAPLLALGAPAQAVVGGERIVNLQGSYPWAVAFVRAGNSHISQRTYCSGTLIKPQWVLTAAHCEFRASDTVVIGREQLSKKGGQTRKIATVKGTTPLVVRRMWNSDKYCDTDRPAELCDLALVRLTTPSSMRNLDLADANELPDWAEGSSARAYGYGLESESASRASDYLKRARLRITDFRANHYTLFARDPRAKPTDAACWADSGAPLIVSTSNGPRLVGVTRAHLANEKDRCRPGDNQSFVKVGWRGSASNSQPYLWISESI